MKDDRIDLVRALRWFLDDTRFHVSVGGNPYVVERMLAEAQAIYQNAANNLIQAEIIKNDPEDQAH